MYRKLSYLLLFFIFLTLTWNFLTFAENIGYEENTPYYFVIIPPLFIISIMKTNSLLLTQNIKHTRLILFYNYLQVFLISTFWFLFNVWLIGYHLNLKFRSDEINTLLLISIIYSFTTFFISFTGLRSISVLKSK